MGTYTLITPTSIGNYNKAERLNLLKRFMALMPGTAQEGGTDEDDDQGASPLSEADGGVPALNISAEQVEQMNGLIDQMGELTLQATSSAETPEMQQLEADRDVAANYILRRISDYDRLPLAAEREAARRLEPVVRPYAGIASLPVGQETEVIRGLAADLAKPDYADDVATLGLAPYIAEMQRLNEAYARLTAQRDKGRSARVGTPDSKTLAARAQDLLDDMCALANASSLLTPSDEAATFIREANYLFAQVRTAYKQRSKGTTAGEADDDTAPVPET